MRRITALAVLILAFAPLAAQEAPWYAEKLEELGFQVPARPEAAPDFQVESLAGGRVALSSLRGKIVLLNFWATWCPPCRAEMPSIQTLWESAKDLPFAVAAVSLGEERQTVRDFVARQGYGFPVYLDPSGAVGNLYGVRAIPTTILVDKAGRVIGKAVGGREYDSPEILAVVRELAAR